MRLLRMRTRGTGLCVRGCHGARHSYLFVYVCMCVYTYMLEYVCMYVYADIYVTS